MNPFRSSLIAAMALALFPMSAAAATPPTIVGPTPASLAASKPTFSWTLGPAGEVVSSITVSSSAVPQADGSLPITAGGEFLWPLDALTSTITTRHIAAGTWYWSAGWKTPDSAAEFERGDTAPLPFVIPAYVRTVTASLTQYSSITAFSARGTYISNGKAGRVVCRIFNGTRLVKSQVWTNTYQNIAKRNDWYCSSLSVPESLDGRQLRLVVDVTSAGKRASITKFFRAS